MRKIILASHGELAEGMKQSVEMIAGKQENLYAISMADGMGPQDVFMKAKECLDRDKESEFVIITDLPGEVLTQLWQFCLRKNDVHLYQE